MLKRTYILIFLIASFVSCQYIREDERYIRIETETKKSNMLLTEFSGIGCVNCPSAHELASELAEANEGRLIIVEMHPKTNAFTRSADPRYDYTSDEADAYYQYFGGTASTPFPTAVLNFEQYEQSYFIPDSKWASAIMSSIISSQITMSCQLDTENGILTTTLKNNSANSTANLRLLYWLVEDSIVGRQLMPDGTLNDEYVHRHLLRQSLNGTWGDNISLDYSAQVDMVLDVGGYMNKDEKYSIVVVALSADTSYMLAVAETPIPNDYETLSETEPFTLTINGVGVITEDTTVTISDTHIDPITGKQEMECRGTIMGTRHLVVDVTRHEMGLDDQLCIGQCVNGNQEGRQRFEFFLDTDISSWYAHYYPLDNAAQEIIYRFRNGARTLNITVIYKPTNNNH